MTGDGWDVSGVFGVMAVGNFVFDELYCEFRAGVSEGDGGILVASGTADITSSAPFLNSSLSIPLTRLEAELDTPLHLDAGQYWFAIAPVGARAEDNVGPMRVAMPNNSVNWSERNTFLVIRDPNGAGANFRPLPTDDSTGLLGLATTPAEAVPLPGVAVAGVALFAGLGLVRPRRQPRPVG